MKQAMFAFASMVLAGCFLEQHKPGPPVLTGGAAIEGVVAVEDMKGPQTGAVFMALFAKKAATTGVRLRIDRPEQSQCRLQREPKAAASALVSVGQLFFGTALQSSHITIEENANHQYLRTLTPDFPAGIYEVAASGKGDIPAFQDYLQVPESLQDVQVNTQAFGSSSVLVRKSQPLVMNWRQPAVPNGDHIVIVDVETETATEKLKLHCLGIESSFATEGASYRWQIGVDQMAQLPESKSIFVYFVRAIVKESKSKTVNLQTQGLRTVYTAAELGG